MVIPMSEIDIEPSWVQKKLVYSSIENINNLLPTIVIVRNHDVVAIYRILDEEGKEV